MQSPSYRLAALDQDFLLGDSMRGVRFLLEFAKADEALAAELRHEAAIQLLPNPHLLIPERRWARNLELFKKALA